MILKTPAKNRSVEVFDGFWMLNYNFFQPLLKPITLALKASWDNTGISLMKAVFSLTLPKKVKHRQKGKKKDQLKITQ